MTKYAMVVDLDRCQGCRACMEACKIENNTMQGNYWMHVFRFEEGTFPETEMSFLPRPCQHCDNAPCVKVCPVGARFKREDGLVLTDADRCIGCRYCELACPYGVNYFNWQKPDKGHYDIVDWQDDDLASVTGGLIPPYQNPDLAGLYGEEQRRTAGGGHAKGIIEKCTFCVHRVEKGLDPACVTTCPTDALVFGDTDDAGSPVNAYLREKRTWHLLEEAGTKPRVYYTGGKPPNKDLREIERPKATV
jgi:molybdopterin-containing oxidoreductase family iron-sulfur binding subunit